MDGRPGDGASPDRLLAALPDAQATRHRGKTVRATAWLTQVVLSLGWPPDRLGPLLAAVSAVLARTQAEGRPGTVSLWVRLQVKLADASPDQSGDDASAVPEPAASDGWGFFILESQASPGVAAVPAHTIELILYRENGSDP